MSVFVDKDGRVWDPFRARVDIPVGNRIWKLSRHRPFIRFTISDASARVRIRVGERARGAVYWRVREDGQR